MRVEIDQAVPEYASYAAVRTRGLYNVDASDGSRFQLAAELPVEGDDWQIGVVVGPSGSGKSSIAKALVEDAGFWEASFHWSEDQPVIEELSSQDGVKYAKATAALSGVGLGSVPSWLRPYRVLSTGEQFRADMANLLVMPGDRAKDVIIDEFTSVLDRQVAKVAAGAFAKTWRRLKGRRIVLVTCHYDILDWVQPDWVLDTSEGLNAWAQDRGVVQPREGSFQPDHGYDGPVIGRVQC